VGAVYAGTNNNGPGGNFVVGFGRRADGTLAPLDIYETGGVGRAALSSPPPRLNSLIAEDSIIAVDNRFLIVVNAGTNDVTSFRINSDYSLSRVDIEPSGGTSPISLAYRNGVVYVANADEDGVFTGPPNQSGNITAMQLDPATGQLTRIAGFSLSLRARPADLEVTPDGAHLVVSALNAGAPQLPQPTAAEVSTFRIQADGTLALVPSGTGMSTQLNNAAGRNLPNAIGIEVFTRGGRQFVVAAEARTASSSGVPGTFATLQTGSVSTWEIGADGLLLPRTQDCLLGPTVTSGPTQAGFVAYNDAYEFASIASSAGAAISSIGFSNDGIVTLVQNDGYQLQGTAADPAAASPLANADGFVDLAFDPSGNFLYHLVSLKGRIDTYGIVFSYERRQQLMTGLLPLDNLQGLVVVGPATG
jgi:6-phosphogluconolactonase (cycloisomerase 2 family)